MKFCVPILLACLTTAAAWADPPEEDVLRPNVPSKGEWFAQFDLGLNYTMMDGNPVYRGRILGLENLTSDFLESADGLAPLVSATVGYKFTPMFGLALRLDYDAKAAGRNETMVDTCELFDVVNQTVFPAPFTVEKDYQVDLDYLTLSLLPSIHFDKFYLFAGPSVGIPLSSSIVETDRMDDESPCSYFFTTDDSTKIVTGEAIGLEENLRVAVKIGAGYTIDIADDISLVPQVGLDLGLTDAFKEDGLIALSKPGVEQPLQSLLFIVNHAIRTTSLQASLGLRINL